MSIMTRTRPRVKPTRKTTKAAAPFAAGLNPEPTVVRSWTEGSFECHLLEVEPTADSHRYTLVVVLDGQRVAKQGCDTIAGAEFEARLLATPCPVEFEPRPECGAAGLWSMPGEDEYGPMPAKLPGYTSPRHYGGDGGRVDDADVLVATGAVG